METEKILDFTLDIFLEVGYNFFKAMKEKSTAVEFDSSRQREPAVGESRSGSRQENTFWSCRLNVRYECK